MAYLCTSIDRLTMGWFISKDMFEIGVGRNTLFHLILEMCSDLNPWLLALDVYLFRVWPPFLLDYVLSILLAMGLSHHSQLQMYMHEFLKGCFLFGRNHGLEKWHSCLPNLFWPYSSGHVPIARFIPHSIIAVAILHTIFLSQP